MPLIPQQQHNVTTNFSITGVIPKEPARPFTVNESEVALLLDSRIFLFLGIGLHDFQTLMVRIGQPQFTHLIRAQRNKQTENKYGHQGTIRILEKANGQGEVVLMNNDNTRIFTPNTALRTTYLMSVLFAIGKLSSEKDNTDFPLLFDAPTSSFTDAKESEFFNVISKLQKQVIIVTKSFLKESNGDVILDKAKIDEVNGRIFRIEKKKPFDDKKLGTIQTVISKIK